MFMLDICNKYLLNMHVNPPSPRAACDTSVVLIERARASKGISIYNLNYKRTPPRIEAMCWQPFLAQNE